MIIGRAVLLRETDDQYTLLIFSKVDTAREDLQSTQPNLTLANAFNAARDALAALAITPAKHQRITIMTTIE